MSAANVFLIIIFSVISCYTPVSYGKPAGLLGLNLLGLNDNQEKERGYYKNQKQNPQYSGLYSYGNNNYNNGLWHNKLTTTENPNELSDVEQLENLKQRLDRLNQAIDDKKKQEQGGNNNNNNPNNGNNNNVTTSTKKPITNVNNNGQVQNHKPKWIKVQSKKFYFQVQPVVPEEEQEESIKTVYYLD